MDIVYLLLIKPNTTLGHRYFHNFFDSKLQNLIGTFKR